MSVVKRVVASKNMEEVVRMEEVKKWTSFGIYRELCNLLYFGDGVTTYFYIQF